MFFKVLSKTLCLIYLQFWFYLDLSLFVFWNNQHSDENCYAGKLKNPRMWKPLRWVKNQHSGNLSLPIYHRLRFSLILSISSMTLRSDRLINTEISISVEPWFSSISLTNFFISLTVFTSFVISFVPQYRIFISG